MKYSVLVTPMGSKNTFSLNDSEDINGKSGGINGSSDNINGESDNINGSSYNIN